MADFTLDTSGEVRGQPLITPPGGSSRSHVGWSDLDPFTQGYIEALFVGESDHLADAARALAARADDTIDLDDQPDAWRDAYRPGFSDLAPETLAAILKDCESYYNSSYSEPSWRKSRGFGFRMWAERQAGKLRRFPPLTVSLDNDAKVRFQ